MCLRTLLRKKPSQKPQTWEVPGLPFVFTGPKPTVWQLNDFPLKDWWRQYYTALSEGGAHLDHALAKIRTRLGLEPKDRIPARFVPGVSRCSRSGCWTEIVVGGHEVIVTTDPLDKPWEPLELLAHGHAHIALKATGYGWDYEHRARRVWDRIREATTKIKADFLAKGVDYRK